MRILLSIALIGALAACGGAKKKAPNNPTNASHEKSGDKDGDDDKDGDVKNKDANEGDDDSSSPKSADPCEGGQ
jgi:hypothetical protein